MWYHIEVRLLKSLEQASAPSLRCLHEEGVANQHHHQEPFVLPSHKIHLFQQLATFQVLSSSKQEPLNHTAHQFRAATMPPKSLYFVRHAQGEHNAQVNHSVPSFYTSNLTAPAARRQYPRCHPNSPRKVTMPRSQHCIPSP